MRSWLVPSMFMMYSSRLSGATRADEKAIRLLSGARRWGPTRRPGCWSAGSVLRHPCAWCRPPDCRHGSIRTRCDCQGGSTGAGYSRRRGDRSDEGATVGVHRNPCRARATRGEHDAIVRAPRRVGIVAWGEGYVHRVSAVGVHHVDVELAAGALGSENDLGAVGRPRGLGILVGAVGQANAPSSRRRSSRRFHRHCRDW